MKLENLWDKYYSKTKNKKIGLHWELIEAITNKVDIEGKRILEVGAGRGNDSIYLSNQGAKATVIDNSKEAIEIISQNAKNNNVKLNIVRADALNLPFKDRSFDLVFHQGLLEHFHNPARIIQEQKRVLKDNGYILIDIPQRYNLWTIKKNILMVLGLWFAGRERSFTLKALKKLLQENGFKPLYFYQRDYYPNIILKIKNLKKIEEKILKHKILPEKFWLIYNKIWLYFEKKPISRIIFKSIGVMAIKS